MFGTLIDKLRASGFSGREGFFGWLSGYIDKALFTIFNVAGAVLFALGGAFAGNYNMETKIEAINTSWDCLAFIFTNPYLSILVGAVLASAGGYGIYQDQSRQQRKIDTLSKEIGDQNLNHQLEKTALEAKISSLSEKESRTRSELDTSLNELERTNSRLLVLHSELIQNSLKHASKHLGFGTFERITLYYEFNDELHLIGRYSQNPIWNKVNRQKFPINQGVIGVAWMHQHYCEKECPDFHTDPEEYYKYNTSRYLIDEETMRALRMRSCRYIAFAVMSAEAHKGVIVFESTDPELLSRHESEMPNEIHRYFHEHQGMYAAYIQESLSLSRELQARTRRHGLSIEEELEGGLING